MEMRRFCLLYNLLSHVVWMLGRAAWIALVVGLITLLSTIPLAAAGRFSVADGAIVVPSPGDDTTTDVLSNRVLLPFMVYQPLPEAPVLDPAVSPLWDQPVTLSWRGGAPSDAYPVNAYRLEESPAPDFATVSRHYTVPAAAVPFTLPQQTPGTMGHYYYRVRGENSWGVGPWSEPQSVLLLSKVDWFDVPETGWAPRRTSYWDLDLMHAAYIDGDLVTRVEDRFDFAIFSPMQPAPELPYVIRMNTKVIHEANETSYGIVFGGNEGAFCDIVRETAADPNGCFSHYYRLNVIWGGYLKYSLKRVDYHTGISDGATGEGEDWGYFGIDWWEGDPHAWNVWEIRVYDTGFAVYINGEFLRWIDDTRYIHEPYYGIFSSTYEYNGARFKHAYYQVEPLTGEDAVPPPQASLAPPSE